MFLMDRRNKMFRKIAIIITMCFFCLGLDNCKSPEAPEPIYEYRYNVEVIYTRAAGNYTQAQDKVRLHYYLHDPAITEGQYWHLDFATIDMNKIGENKYRNYLHKVFIHTPRESKKHRVIVDDFITNSGMKGESVDIQGAFEQEIIERHVSLNAVRIMVDFKMSKE